jgi:hypothetical protein
MTPAGIEIRMAIEKAKAIITSDARIFRLEIFLSALFNTPKNGHHKNFKIWQPGRG